MLAWIAAYVLLVRPNNIFICWMQQNYWRCPITGRHCDSYSGIMAESSDESRAQIVNLSKSGIQKTLKRKHETGSYNVNKRRGTPCVASTQTDIWIHRLSCGTPTASNAEIQENPEAVSTYTIRRRLLKEFHLKSCLPAVKSLQTKKNINNQLDFWRIYQNFTDNDWDRVSFFGWHLD